jgi:hypothetical protein
LPTHRVFRRRFAHSHSGSQFLPHLPSHWYSDILPPHCGQTRLRIDERMRTFNSAGGASMVIMFEVSPRSGEGQKRGQNDGGMPRRFCALCDAPNWLAAESVHASRAAPSLSMGQAISMPPSIAKKKPLTKLVASKPGFYRAGHMGKQRACVPKFGRSLAHQELRRCSRPPDRVTRQDGGATDATKRQRKWGILLPRSAKSTTQQSGERRSNDSVWKVKCLEEVGEERLSAQRRVEPQCESHSSQ